MGRGGGVGGGLLRGELQQKLCGACAEGYYKLGVFCKKCPSATSVGLIVVVCIGGLLLLAFLCWIIASGVNFTLVSIAINFFQVR